MVRTISGCDFLLNAVKSDKYTLSKISLKSHSQHTITTMTFKSGQSKNIWTDSERYTTKLHVVPVVALTFNSLSLRDPVKNMWCVKSKQYFIKFWDKGFILETIHWWWLYIKENKKFSMDLHIKAYDLNHWLLSLYGVMALSTFITL